MPEPRSDAELAHALGAREEGAAREVEAWVRRAATSFRFRLAADWEDAVQACLLEILTSLRDGRYSAAGSLRGYVWRLTVRSCIDRVRVRARWQWVELDPERGSEASALASLLANERREQLLAVAARVPDGCRRLWNLVLAGRSYREMSEVLGVREGALRVRLLRCRRLAQEIARELAAGPGNAGVDGAPETQEGARD